MSRREETREERAMNAELGRWTGDESVQVLEIIRRQQPTIPEAQVLIQYLPKLLSAIKRHRIPAPNEFHTLLGLDIKREEGELKNDQRKIGWRLLKHVPRRIHRPEFECGGMSPVFRDGNELRRECHRIGAAGGQEDLEYMLEHQANISFNVQDKKIVFPETVWADASGERFFPCALFSKGQKLWYLRFCSVKHDYGNQVVFAFERGYAFVSGRF